ncbi:family 10 glycosylhydrolase [Inconstantimicrobium mannanitabidum]|uniref:Uncharacterized protein n=1 Tax=Inconstantimicrobium mannanitabidum TaxID=1604901 RepID=A0ACB5RE07_9CLOT|nr:family 10 glycosylhydrolase [Clostridium sp. TW13]GKX67500.1 hypothetical protein rsdtw13_27580 [Clostridium sp. TW13]
MKKKKTLYMLLILLFTASLFTPNVVEKDVYAANLPQNMQAAWIATVYNLDYPSTQNNMASQKNEFIQKLDKLKSIGINTVVVQVRPKADAFYKSSINPWSEYLTGVQGKNPGYDPMDFMIKEAHKRGMSFHAWLNPYRVTMPGSGISSLSKNHPARLHPDWVLKYNDALYYNPAVEGVKKHIVDTVVEIVKKYDVDAIHFDDYFYPSNYPLPQGQGKDGSVANSRRQNVNDMVKRVGKAIKSTKKNVLFGISPAGIWKNKESDATGSNTLGNECYYSVFSDTRAWIKNGWIDYIVPQIYWETGNKAADYETLVKWWSNEVKGTKVKLYIGQGIYKNVVANQIDTQLQINKKYSQVGGSFYFSLKDLLSDKTNCKDKIKAFNQNKSQGSNTNTSNKSSQNKVKTGIVTASVLNVRSGPGLNYSILTTVSRGARVTILGSKNGWYNVKLSSGRVAWVSMSYVKVN